MKKSTKKIAINKPESRFEKPIFKNYHVAINATILFIS